MKKIYFLLFFVILHCVSFLKAQDYVDDSNFTKYLMKSEQLFIQHNYLLSSQLLPGGFSISDLAPYVMRDANFLNALSSAKLNDDLAESYLLTYIEKYPHSAHNAMAKLALANFYFLKNNYSGASYWFSRIDFLNIPKTLQEQASYLYAYSLLQEKRFSESDSLFETLIGSEKYGEASTFYLAFLKYSRQDYNSALMLWNRVHKNSRFYPSAQIYKSEIYLSQNKYLKAFNAAADALNKLNEEEQQSEILISGSRVVGLSSFLLGNYNQSLKYMRQYMSLEKNPGRLELFAYARDLYETEDYSQAIAYFEKAGGNKQNYMAQLSSYYRGLSNLSLRRLRPAYEDFSKSTEINLYPSLTQASAYNASLILYHSHQGDVGRGTSEMIKYLNAYPNGEQRAKLEAYLVEAYRNTSNIDEALREISQLSALPKSIRAAQQQLKLRNANRLMGKGYTDEAGKQYDDIIQNNSDHESVLEALLWKSELAYRQEKFHEVILLGREYLDRAGKQELNPIIYYNSAYSYYNLRDWQNAKTNFIHFLSSENKPSKILSSEIYNRLGDISEQLRDYGEAVSFYERSEQLHEANSDYAVLHIAKIYGLRKEYHKKTQRLESLVISYPQSKYIPEALYEKGRSYLFLKENDKAIKDFENVLFQHALSDFAPKAGVQLALQYYNDNNLQKAAEIYEYVIRKYPRTESAQSALEDLKAISVDLNQVDVYSELSALAGTKSLSPNQIDSLNFLAAEKLLSEDKKHEALEAFNRYLESYPNGLFSENAKMYKGQIMYQTADFKGAESILLELQSSSNSYIKNKSVELLADLYVKANEPGKAAEKFLQVALLSSSRNQRSSALSKALKMARLSDSDDFILQLANDVYNTRVDAGNQAANIMSEAALILLRKDDFISAAKYATKAESTAKENNLVRAKVVLAYCDFNSGNIKKAKTKANSIVKAGTSDLYLLSKTFILLSDISVAEGDITTALEYLNGVKSNYSNKNDEILSTVNKKIKALK